jgi:uncharacterized delta-60 repeat protein
MKRSKTISLRTAVTKTREVRLFLAIACSVVLLSLNLPATIHADDGDLDPGFGEGGKITTGFGNGANSIAVQPDGKLVLAGGGTTDFALARYNGDGTLDSSFGENGKVTTEILHHYNWAFAVAIQTDGKIVAAGGAGDFSTSDGFALVRYNSDGSLDSSFGDGGKVTTAFDGDWNGEISPMSESEAYAIAIQSDGMIVAGGYVDGIPAHFALARYKYNGKLDKSFGDGGKVTTSFSNFSVTARSMAIQPDGKIVLAGHAGSQDGRVDFALARYNSDGSLDSTFGASGKVTTDLFGQVDAAYAAALQPDGRIVLVGFSGIVAGFGSGGEDAVDFALVRYNSDGSLDKSFGSGGKVVTDFGNNEAIYAVGIQRDGCIVAAGAALFGNTSDFALARYNSDGSLDSTFGSTGKITTDISGWDEATALAILPGGRIVAAGYSSTGFALACYQIEAFIPNITGAEVGGKKLYVYGKNFDNGAELMMNGEKQKKTFNDEVTPATMLVAGKSGRNIAPGETVTLQVRNSDGSMSNQFSFTRPVQ